jgi:hypothetical protein
MSIETITGRNMMKRLSTLAVTAMLLLFLGVILFAGDAVAQQKSLKEQLVGTWKLVSSHNVRSDGSRVDNIGPNPKGILIYTSDGHFALVNTSEVSVQQPRSGDSGGIQGRGARIDRLLRQYSVNEATNVITAQIEGSTFANMIGGPNQETNYHLPYRGRTEIHQFCVDCPVRHFNWSGSEPGNVALATSFAID